jgi:lysozyme
MKIERKHIAALALSASALVGLIAHEGYTDKAVIPTKNDRPTVGFGSTFKEDGSPVKMGDTITPHKAIARTLNHIQKDEINIRSCVKAPLSQVEYDTMVDFAYQYGTGKLCSSDVVKQANAENYTASCKGYLLYRYSGGYDCSTPSNKRCSGVWARSQERHNTCMGAQ